MSPLEAPSPGAASDDDRGGTFPRVAFARLVIPMSFRSRNPVAAGSSETSSA